jgi:replication fork protection complex subunit Tof1/Swi1
MKTVRKFEQTQGAHAPTFSLESDELLWLVPSKILPSAMQDQLNVITQYLEKPLDFGGKKASELLSKKPRKRRRKRVIPEESDDEESEEPEKKRKKEKRQKEFKQYKSADMIEDSDVDDETWTKFFEQEKRLQQKTAIAAMEGGSSTMRNSGTKKRQRKNTKGETRAKRRKGTGDNPVPNLEKDENDESEEEKSLFIRTASPHRSSVPHDPAPPSPAASDEDSPAISIRPRPRPRPRYTKPIDSPSSSPPTSKFWDESAVGSPKNTLLVDQNSYGERAKVKKSLIISDDEE